MTQGREGSAEKKRGKEKKMQGKKTGDEKVNAYKK